MLSKLKYLKKHRRVKQNDYKESKWSSQFGKGKISFHWKRQNLNYCLINSTTLSSRIIL